LLYKGLQDGKVQLIFGDAMSLSLRMNPASASDNSNGACCHFVGGAYPAPEFLGQGMAIALRKQDADLRLAFNNALTALERKGVLDDLYLRYFPVGFY
jgi:polar amino acid transport system substrate-binding protein